MKQYIYIYISILLYMIVAENPHIQLCTISRAHATDPRVFHWLPFRPFILPDFNIYIYISTQFIVRYERDHNSYSILFFRQELLQQLEEEKEK
jgi:hypothetical protein